MDAAAVVTVGYLPTASKVPSTQIHTLARKGCTSSPPNITATVLLISEALKDWIPNKVQVKTKKESLRNQGIEPWAPRRCAGGNGEFYH